MSTRLKSARPAFFGALAIAALALFLVALPAMAGSGTVTVQLRDSGNAGLAGGVVEYYQGGWQPLGTTDGSGDVSGTVPITTDIRINYKGGTYKWVNVDPAASPTLTINTVAVTAKLETCAGTPLVGTAKYYFNGWTDIGPTPAKIELLPYSALGPGQASYDFRVAYNGRTSPTTRQDISVDPVVVFKTTKVSLFGSNVLYYNGGWQPLASPTELIGGTSNISPFETSWVDVKFNGPSSPTVTLNVGGCSLIGGMATLVDEVGAPLANYPADYPGETRNLAYTYRCGGSWGPTTSFKTDANGRFWVSPDCSSFPGSWDKKITVTLNQTTKEQDVTVNSVFQAAKVNVNLKSCTGPITATPGGSVNQGGGFWYTQGSTGPSGTVSFYTFPGSIKVRMDYNHHSQTLYPTIVAGTNDVDFQTTRVTLGYPGDIKSNMGGSWWMFSKPSMDLLPGSYNFWFQNGGSWYGPVTINVTGCTIDSSYVLLRVRDELGNGVAGGTATPAIGGSWQPALPGVTNASGYLFAPIAPGYTKIKMTVNQGTVEQTTAQLAASNYTWTTQVLRINLKNHAGALITDGLGVLDQGGSFWYAWGNLNTSGYRDIQLFAGSYKFRVTYNYTSQELFPVVTAGAGIQEFDFQTGQVIGCGQTQYSTGAWRPFSDGMELMPGTYPFRYPAVSGTVTAGGITYLSCPV